MKEIRKKLISMQDKKYREFHAGLIPTKDKDAIIGVRVPKLRAYAKEIIKQGKSGEFIKELPHKYYEEYMLHVIILSHQKDFDEVIKETERILPYIDNWAVCDTFSPKVFRKNTEALLPYIDKWLKSDREYTVRFGVKMLMDNYLDENYIPQCLEKVAAVRNDEFYVRMMIAWFFATALAKRYDAAVRYIEENRLEKWTHNKTIQKAVESYRVTDEHKAYLKTLRRK